MWVEANDAGKGDIRVGFSYGGGMVEISVGENSDYHVVHLKPEAAERLALHIQELAEIVKA